MQQFEKAFSYCWLTHSLFVWFARLGRLVGFLGFVRVIRVFFLLRRVFLGRVLGRVMLVWMLVRVFLFDSWVGAPSTALFTRAALLDDTGALELSPAALSGHAEEDDDYENQNDSCHDGHLHGICPLLTRLISRFVRFGAHESCTRAYHSFAIFAHVFAFVLCSLWCLCRCPLCR